jgi:hypothetical protein
MIVSRNDGGSRQANYFADGVSRSASAMAPQRICPLPAIAALTRKNKVPNPISIRHLPAVFENPGEEVVGINLGQ